jgi:peptide-O-fucosyltransferase
VDRNGYVLYCPCMGRFGNQADHFLGSLAFAHGLNRTLVLPPWVEYDYRKPHSIQVPFKKYFKVEPLREYHRVMTMEDFMSDLAPTIWPVGKRMVYCFSHRQGILSPDDGGCNAKDGNPFGPFWDTFSVNFDGSVFYSPLFYDTEDPRVAQQWKERFPAKQHPVLAFTGAPASFPVEKEHVDLHRYLQWSDEIEKLVDDFVRKELPSGPFVAVHLRIGPDWVNVCKHVADMTNRHHLFASAQCLGYDFEYGNEITYELCFPSEATILKQIKSMVKKTKAVAVVVATDSQAMIDKISKALNRKVTVVQRLPSDPHVDLALLARADYYIGNCISTFSAFATRERRVNSKPVAFWAFDEKHTSDEL